MTDEYYIGCNAENARWVEGQDLIKERCAGPDEKTCYFVLSRLHGEFDIMSEQEQRELFDDPEIPSDIKEMERQDLLVAEQNRAALRTLLEKLIQLGDQPHFIINDLGTMNGDWRKFTSAQLLSLASVMQMHYFHYDHWFVVIGY